MHARRPRLITLILLSALAVLSMNMFAPAMGAIATALDVPYGLANLAISGYLALTAVLQLIIGPLSDRYGRRPVMLVALLLFAIASAAAALAQHIGLFLLARVAQGAIVAGTVLPRAIIRDTSTPQEGASIQGYLSMAMAIAPILGPALGGAMAEHLGWRTNFWLYVVFAMVLLLWCWRDLSETHLQRSANFKAQLLLYPQLFKAGEFWGYALCIAFSVSAFFMFVSGVPQVAGQQFSLSQGDIGLLMGTISIGFFFGSFIAGWRSKHHAITTMMIAGRSIAVLGLGIGCAIAWFHHVSPWVVFGATVSVGVANGVSFPSSHTGAMSVQPRLAGSAAGLSGALSMLIGAMLTGLVGVWVQGPQAAQVLLSMMLATALMAWAMALWTCAMRRRKPQAGPTVQA